MGKVLEKDVQSACIEFMRNRGWRWVRTQFAHSPGMFSTGEPGCCDGQFIKYMPAPNAPARALFFWCEYKSERDRRTCFCDPSKPKKPCKVCRQKRWQEKERARGALVIQTSSMEAFAAWYEREFGWLHRDTTPLGNAPIAAQMGLLD